MGLLNINKFDQHLVHDLLDLVMHMFFPIQSLQLSILDMDRQEFLVSLDYIFYVFV